MTSDMAIALWRKHRAHDAMRSTTVNAGLLLRRGLPQWPRKTERKADSESTAGSEKAGVIARIVDLPVPEAYAWAYGRWQRATTGADFLADELDLLGRLYIGLSRESALETGMTVQHAWGLPMIPGSALKGISRHVARTASTLRDEADAIAYLFGSDDDARPESGAVVFHDAWWVPGSAATPFAAEVVTPHHGAYYAMGSRHATDFDKPVPAPQIAAQGRFRFVVQGDPAWARLALALLRLALTTHGVGGKTTSGYGLFAPPAT